MFAHNIFYWHNYYTVFLLSSSAAPEIVGSPQNETRLEGDVAMFNCSTEAEPLPTVQWFFQGNVLSSSPNYTSFVDSTGTIGRLIVHDVKQDDMGRYTCVVNNTHGSASASAYLHVQGQYQ